MRLDILGCHIELKSMIIFVPFHISTLHSSSITNIYPPRENNDCLSLESQHGENEMM